MFTLKCADEEDDVDDSNSLNGGYGKPSTSPYEDDDLGELNLSTCVLKSFNSITIYITKLIRL